MKMDKLTLYACMEVSPSSVVKNEMAVSSLKPYLFPAARDISYVVYGMRLFNVYSLTLFVVIFRKGVLSFLSLILYCVRRPYPIFTGSIHDILALLDLILVTVSFLGLSGCRAKEKNYAKSNTNFTNKIAFMILKSTIYIIQVYIS